MTKFNDMRVKDLKDILNKLPDDMKIVIPVVDEDNVNQIYGFRMIRTAGILEADFEQDRNVLCLNGAADGHDIADQVYFSRRDVSVTEILYGDSKYTGTESEPTN